MPSLIPIHLRTLRGAALLEYALVLPMLAFLAVGIADMSAAWRTKHLLTEAAREGARTASVLPNLQQDDPRVQAVVDDVVQQAGLHPLVYAWSLTFPANPGGTALSGNPVTVTVTHAASAVSGAGLSPLALGVTLEGSSTMRYERRTIATSSGATPGPPALPCNCTAWISQGCGQGSCGSGQELQTRACSPNGCGASSQCQASAVCP